MKIGKIKFSICTFQFAISNITGDVMEAQLLKNENWKNKIFNLHFPICNFKYNGRCHGGTV
ncbi:MAG: hypothetical protein COS94_09465, partial [Candidatus Hydrogenedentes bacterium CG07_land_8_20_14_0_80_42_17]